MMATYTGKEPFAIFSRWVAKDMCDALGITETMSAIEGLMRLSWVKPGRALSVTKAP